MLRYVQVVVNLPQVDGAFDYHVPEEMESVQIGSLVLVPFGSQIVQGIITQLIHQPQVSQTKAIIGVVDSRPVMTEAQFQLANWMAKETVAPLTTCLQLMVPPGLNQQADRLFTLISNEVEVPLSPLQRLLITRLEEKGPQRGRQLERAFPRRSWRESIKRLQSHGMVRVDAYLPAPKVQPKKIKMVQLACDPARISDRLEDIGRQGKAAERRKQIMDLVLEEPWGVSASVLYAMTGGSLADLKKLAEEDLIQFTETEIFRDPMENYEWVKQTPPTLTVDQRLVWQRIEENLKTGNNQKPYLLHGVTGSGKTEIYLKMVGKVLNQGGQAIVLVPEISLTPQTVRRFHARFPGQVGIVHSKLSMGERYDTWRRARNGDLSVVVGPRSALFTPFENLKLIILDESHDDSYMQDDFLPHYHAVTTAEAYARFADAFLLYGSATPSIDMVYRAKRENWPILEMPGRVLAHRLAVSKQIESSSVEDIEGDVRYMPLPKVSIVDMRSELKSGNRSMFSRELHQSIQETLEQGYQTILFLNRRGTATYVFCRDCGYRLTCPQCDIPLTFHQDKNQLICHLCNYSRFIPKTCPQCSSTRVRQFGTGTEKVEQEVSSTFPGARVLRMDSGVTRQKGAHEFLLKQFANRQADILVGTQMLAKGIDLPFVTLVGVVLADVGLNMPDFRASERTFQLLTQVAGRAGRSPLGGKVIFQTYQPDEYPIQFAAKHDFNRFYEHEIISRSKMVYPPFSRLIRLEFRNQNAGVVKSDAERTAMKIQHWIETGNFKQSAIIGPVPCFYQRVSGYYRWQLIVRGPAPLKIIEGKDLGGAIVTVDPVNLL
ncbi:MAG: primosomal protein N' [Anaerolineaceae bacterium]|nr:primosomal protein N' [Anaerolineaceae bacterium]